MAINIKPSHKGLLHKKLGVPQGQHIPAGKLSAALHSSSPALRKEANFARNASHWNHGKGLGDHDKIGAGHFGYKPAKGKDEHHERQMADAKRALKW